MSHGPEPWGVRPDHEPIAPTGPPEYPTSAATPPRPGTPIIRPMPSSAAAPSFEALAVQSVLSRARDDTRFERPPDAQDTGQAKRLPVRGLLAVAVGILVLGVLGGTLWVSFFRDVPIDGDTIVKTSQSPGVEILTPQQVVRGYLDALAAGDIAKALAYGPRGGEGSQVLLTAAAHGAMPPASRPDNISILTDDALATEVDVSYTLGGEEVTTAMRVVRQDNGSYEMARTTVTMQMEMVGGDNVPTFLNGTSVDPSLLMEVVPGTYTPSTGLPFVAFPASSSISIVSLAYTGTAVFTMNPELTLAGRTALLKKAKASLADCIDSRELSPTGCPNAISAPKPVVSGSVRWELTDEDSLWSSFSPTLSSSDQSVAVAAVNLRLRVSMDYTNGQSSGINDPSSTVALRATMLGNDADSVSVIWGD